MSSNLPSDYRKSSIQTSSDYIERVKQQSNYIYKQRFEYEQSISFPPILGPSFNGGGSSTISSGENLTTLTGGYQFYNSGGTIEEILPPSAFAPVLTVTLSIYQMGILLCSWDPHPNSTSYTIDFYETSFDGSPVYTYSPISGTTLYTAGEFPIQNGRRYGVRVKGVDEAVGDAVFSSLLLYSFTASVSVQRVGSLSCAWDARPGYTSFTIDFYETSFSTSSIYTEQSIVGTTFSTSDEFPLVSGRSYGISVRGDAEDPSGASYSSLLPYNFTATVSQPNTESIRIAWDAHPNVSTYTVRIDENTSGNTVWTYNTVSGTSLDTTGEFTLVNGSTYSAVITGTGLGASASVTSPFFTYTGVGPTLTATVAIQSVDSLGLSWEAHPGYSTYTVIVYEDTSGTIVHTYTAVSGTSLTTLFADVPLVGGRTYGISVLGTSEATGNRVYSSFTSYPIYTVTISEPAEESLRIAWDAHPNVSTYTVRIDEDVSGNTLFTYTAVSGTSLDTTGEFALVNGTTYSAVVTGTGLGASASVRSPFFTYTITSPKINLIAANYSGTGAWLDESGNGFNATLGSGTAAKNGPGNGIILDGSTFWTFPNISAGAAWTVILWYKTTGSSIPPDQYACILVQLPSNTMNIMIGNFGSTDIKAGFLNNSYYTSNPIVFDIGVWKNIAVTYDGITLLTYINGTLFDTQVFNVPSTDSGQVYRIGRRWDSPEYVVGEIGELIIYPSAKPATTIQAFYTDTVANYPITATISQSVYTSLRFSWDAHLGSTTYTIDLYTDPSGIPVYTYSSVSGISLNTSTEITLLNNTLYTIRVIGNGDASGSIAPVYSLPFLSNTLYPSISIASPYSSFAISWYPAFGATTYDVQLYSSTTASIAVPGTATLLYTYTAVSGTSLSTGVEVTPTNGFYYFVRVKVTGEADSAYKLVPASIYLWNIGLTTLNISLSHNTTDDSVTVSWTRDPSELEPFTLNTYQEGVSTAIASYDQGTSTTYTLPYGSLPTTARMIYVTITLTNVPLSIAYISEAIPYVTQLQLLLQGSAYSGSGRWLDQGPYYAYNPTLVQGVAQKNSGGNAILFDGATYWTLGQVQFPTYSFWIKTRGIPPVGPSSAGGILTQDYNPTIDQFVSCFVAGLTSFSVANRWYYPGLPSDTGIGVTTTDGVWNHILISNLASASSGPRAWINGVYVGQAGGGVGTSGNGFPMSIGRDTINGNGVPTYFVGELGEIAAYQTIITDTAGANTVYNISKDLYIGTPLTSLITQRIFSSLHFLWDHHPGSTTYDISLYTDPSGAAVYTYTGVTGVYVDTGVEISLLNDTLYTIGVIGDASGASVVYSPAFLTNTLYPSVALHSSYTTLNLAWNPAIGASTYVVELYNATTSATVLSGYTTLVHTYTAVSGTSLTTAGEITLVDASYYFIRVKVTGQTDASYKTAASSLFVWGGGTNLGLTLVNQPNGSLRASWSAAAGVYQGYTVSIYAAADSSLLTSANAASSLTYDLVNPSYVIGASYYATLTLTNIAQSAPLSSSALVYDPLVLSLQATTYSGTGTWADESSYGNDATINTGTPSLNEAGNGVVFDGSLAYVCADFGDLPNWSIVTWFKRTAPLPVASAILCQAIDGGNMKLYSENVDQPAPTQLCGGMASYQGYAGALVTFPLNEWHQMTVTWDGATMKSYFDGSVYDTQSFPNIVTTTNNQVYVIGRSWFIPSFIIGEIGALRVYGKALSPTFVSNYYASTVSTYT
jgi:hypothetical protein